MESELLSPAPTYASYLREIVLGGDGARRFPGVDLISVLALAKRVAFADNNPKRPYCVVVKGDERDFCPVLATLLSGRPLLVLDGSREFSWLRQMSSAADALPIDIPLSITGLSQSLPEVFPQDTALIVSTSGTLSGGKLWGRSQAALIQQAVVQGSHMLAGEGKTFSPLGRYLATPAITGIGLAMVGGANYQPFYSIGDSEQGLLDKLKAQAPEFISCTPTIFRGIARAAMGTLPWDLKGVWFSGEPVRASDIRLFEKVTQPGTTLHVHYGSTETGNIACGRLDTIDLRGGGALPVGQVSPLVNLRVVDDDGLDVAVGDVGRILVDSPLLGQPIGHTPAHRETGGPEDTRYFDVGDDGYLDANGNLTILGRRDGAVKISGVRVDSLGLEEKISTLTGVSNVSVFGATGLSGGDVLAVAVELEAGHTVTSIDSLLRQGNVAERRAVIVDIGQFPVTHSQKTDLALVRKRFDQKVLFASKENLPATQSEKLVANCWAQVLGIEAPSCNIPFEALGGDSLALLRIALMLEQRFGLSLPKELLGDYRTIAAQAEALRPCTDNDTSPCLVPLSEGGDVVLVCCPGIGGHAWIYSALAAALSPEVATLGVDWVKDTPEEIANQVAVFSRERPVVLLGFSGGCRSAWLIGSCLLKRGICIDTMVVLDGDVEMRIGKRHLVRAIERRTRHQTHADKYLSALGHRGRVWHRGKQMMQLPLHVLEVRGSGRMSNRWGRSRPSAWSGVSQSVTTMDIAHPHSRIVKAPILPEVVEVVKRACNKLPA